MPRNREEADLFFCSVTSLQKCETRTKTLAEIEDEIRVILRPLMADRESRKARLDRAFSRCPGLLDRINLDGETGVFLSNLVSTLRQYGEIERDRLAVCVLLESINGEVGLKDRESIGRILTDFPR